MASFIARAMKLPAATKDYFTDDNGKTHEADINRIAEAGLTNGCAPGLYCRNDSVSRAQMAGFLVRALDLPRRDEGLLHRRQQQLARVRDQRHRRGRPDRWLRRRPVLPLTAVTREQMAAFLLRAFKPD